MIGYSLSFDSLDKSKELRQVGVDLLFASFPRVKLTHETVCICDPLIYLFIIIFSVTTN